MHNIQAEVGYCRLQRSKHSRSRPATLFGDVLQFLEP